MIMNNIIELLKKSQKICITGHMSPDGDSAGSVLALTLGLRSIGKQVNILACEDIPDTYGFLTGSTEFNNKVDSVPADSDCVVILDCGNKERINAKLQLKDRKYTLINIDHHASNDMYGELNYVDANAAAVGEIVYQMLKIMGIEINENIAECLYTSILTDTGSFRFSNTTSITHTIAGDLINCGINVSDIYRRVYENKKYTQVKMNGAAIQNMELYFNDRLCIIEISQDTMKTLGLSKEEADTSDVLRFGMEISTVEAAVLIKEIDNGVKLSFRSKSIVDVRKIAELFGGGGHVRASGAAMNKSLKEAKNIIIDIFEKEL